MISRKLETFLIKIGQEADFKKGEYVFKEGEKATKLYVIVKGAVSLIKDADEGQKFCYRIAKEGELMGDITLFSENQRYITDAICSKDTEMYEIEKSKIETHIIGENDLLKEYLKWSGEAVERMHSKFRDLVLFGKKGALYSTLIRLSNSFGVVKKDGIFIDLKLTNQEISELCGTTRESVNRMLSELKKEKIIELTKGGILIHNIDYLRKEIKCQNCPFEICQI